MEQTRGFVYDQILGQSSLLEVSFVFIQDEWRESLGYAAGYVQQVDSWSWKYQGQIWWWRSSVIVVMCFIHFIETLLYGRESMTFE